MGSRGTGLISLVGAWLLQRQDHSLKLWEKIIERRIHAHDSLLNAAMEMRGMVALGYVDANVDPLRVTYALLSKAHFEDFFARFTGASLSGSAWQTIAPGHEDASRDGEMGRELT
ncbi:protein of unknown function [Nitratireductor aquimarinus]|uniref:hypothetical protein n=1 Tax=Nitratireductor aquimarinus TaxID=889300 RepID=UPI003B5C462B